MTGLAMNHPWPRGAVTGLGSLPGTDPDEAVAQIFGELGDLPHIPELPARGPGADLLGRGASLLVDLFVEIVPSGWRLTSRPGRELRRARDFLSRDLDALEAQAEGYTGALKLQVAGPWTLAAGIEVPSGHKIVNDPGATRDLAESLAEGIRVHLADVARRVPGAQLVLQLDEPSVSAVIDGRVSTPSGYGTVRSVDVVLVEQRLRDVLEVAAEGSRVVHCCAADVPIASLREAGANAIALDAAQLSTKHNDALGEAIEAGTSIWLGVLPSTGDRVSYESARKRIRGLWSELGFPEEQLADAIVPTPACGLADASPAHARKVLEVLRDLGRDLLEPDERPH